MIRSLAKRKENLNTKINKFEKNKYDVQKEFKNHKTHVGEYK